MAIKILRNDLKGLYAVPDFHPVTCANPAPWKIEEMEIVRGHQEWLIWIRNEESMWFRLDQCFVHTQEECEELIHIRRLVDTREKESKQCRAGKLER